MNCHKNALNFKWIRLNKTQKNETKIFISINTYACLTNKSKLHWKLTCNFLFFSFFSSSRNQNQYYIAGKDFKKGRVSELPQSVVGRFTEWIHEVNTIYYYFFKRKSHLCFIFRFSSSNIFSKHICFFIRKIWYVMCRHINVMVLLRTSSNNRI